MKALFVTLDAGGNLAPALNIAREIVRRGGAVRFLGHEPQRVAVEAAGFAFEPVRQGRAYDSVAPRSTLSGVRDLTAVFADRGIGTDALRLVAAEPVDVVVVDCLLLGALDMLVQAGLPVVSLVHTTWDFFQRETRGPIGAIMLMRGIRMRRVLASPAMSLVTVRTDFEPSTKVARPPGVRHVGVTWQTQPRAAHAPVGPAKVLVSLSTTRFPGQETALQSILDGLADLDIEVMVTTGPAVDPAALRAPANATIHRYLDHDTILPEASLVIGHGGHGTTTRALSYGLPLVVMPMHPMMDQPAIGAAVVRLGAGIMLAKSARPAAIRAAAAQLLADGPHRTAAARLGASIRERNGATEAVDLLTAFTARSVAKHG